METIASLEGDFVLDGELVALDSQGRPSFQMLQNIRSQSLQISYYAFDLLNRNGELLVNLPFSAGASCWRACLPPIRIPSASFRYYRHRPGKFLRRCANSVWKTSSASRIDSAYERGERSDAWIKLRANLEQEFVIGGYIPGTHKFDALLVGVYENKELVFVAKVKNGFVPRIGTRSSRLLRCCELRSARSRICLRREPRGGENR